MSEKNLEQPFEMPNMEVDKSKHDRKHGTSFEKVNVAEKQTERGRKYIGGHYYYSEITGLITTFSYHELPLEFHFWSSQTTNKLPLMVSQLTS